MTSLFQKTLLLLCILAVLPGLSGCSTEPMEPAVPETIVVTLPPPPQEAEETTPATDPKDQVEHLSAVLEAGEIYTLEHYPNLKSVDLTGSTCYDTILGYMAKHPEVDVTYSVFFGSGQVSNQESTATLAAGSYDAGLLAENLQYLPSLTSLTLSGAQLSAEQAAALKDRYPELDLRYTVEILGTSCDTATTELDLKAMGHSQVEDVAAKLGLLTNLKNVYLSNSLSFGDVDRLQSSNPAALFHYSFNLFGKTLSTTDTEVYFKGLNIGNEGEDEIREALPVLDSCERFVLDNCKLDYEVLAQIREDFRDQTKVVWRVFFGVNGRYNTLTDDDTLRCVENVTNDTCGPLKYCEDAKHIDLGHNDTLSDLSFVQYMPKLETLIVSGCAVTDISGFENCKNLLWLEMAYCAKLKDITPLAGCESLKFLNLSFTGVSSYIALDALPLERFVCLSPKAPTKEQNTFMQIHPKDECITVFYGYTNPYGYGWRYNDNGKTMFWYYKDVVREVFNLDQADAILKAQKENQK